MRTYHAVFLRLRSGYRNAVVGIEIRREKVDDGTDPMVPDPHGPLELRHGVEEDYVPQMAFTLQSVASQSTRRTDAVAYPHRNRVSGVVDVRDVLSRWLEGRAAKSAY